MSVLLVDGDNLLTIGFHGLKNHFYKGQHIGAIYHFINTLRRSFETYNLDKIVVWSRVAPKQGLMVGFGVVTGIFQYSQPECRVYEVLTDFGYFIKFTQSEFCDIYTNEIYY